MKGIQGGDEKVDFHFACLFREGLPNQGASAERTRFLAKTHARFAIEEAPPVLFV
jgi:hypothetical protein